MIIEAGDMIIEAGDMIIEAGDMNIEAGDMIIEAGDMIIEAGDMTGEVGNTEAEAPGVSANLADITGEPTHSPVDAADISSDLFEGQCVRASRKGHNRASRMQPLGAPGTQCWPRSLRSEPLHSASSRGGRRCRDGCLLVLLSLSGPGAHPKK
jgi:hypothetical protein